MPKSITNRQNAQRSTGPKTAQGVSISSKNAIKHGITSRDTVLASESKEEYEHHLSAVIGDLAVEGEVEMLLAQRVANCAWRLRRVLRIESQLFNSGEDEAQEDAILCPSRVFMQDRVGIGEAFHKMETSSGLISNITKYEAGIERSMYRALHELQRLQASRRGLLTPAPMAIDIDFTGMPSQESKGS